MDAPIVFAKTIPADVCPNCAGWVCDQPRPAPDVCCVGDPDPAEWDTAWWAALGDKPEPDTDARPS